MRLSRLVPAVAAGALLVASTSPVHAQSDPPPVSGVGTTTGELTLLGLDAGDLLSLDLLSDGGRANIDESVGARAAAAQIAALALDTAATDPISVPLLAVESTGEPQETGQEIALPANPLVSGSALPLSLSALVDEAGATSTLAAALADLDVLGGILTLEGTNLDLGSNALVADADGSRGIDVDALTVLDLEALLAGLGIPLTDLPLDDLLGLLDGLGLLGQLQPVLDQLGIDVADLSVEGVLGAVDGIVDQAGGLLDQVDTLTGQIGSLEDLQADLGGTGAVCDVTDPGLDLLDDLLGGGTTAGDLCADVTGTLTSVTSQLGVLEADLTQVTDLLDGLLDQLDGLSSTVLDLLGGQALLELQGLDISVLTKATDDVATSVADVTASIGSLQVGDLSLPGIQLADATAPVDALLAQVEGAIGGILGEIGGGQLAEIVSLRTLEETTSIEEVGEHVVATADFTGLVVEVLPGLADLDGLLAGLGGADSLGATLEGLGLPVPTSGATEVLGLSSLLSGVTGGVPVLAALEDGLTMRVASLSQQSAFTPVASPTAPGSPAAPGTPGSPAAPTLPRTGSDDALVLALAGAAVLAALGGRHLLRRSSDG